MGKIHSNLDSLMENYESIEEPVRIAAGIRPSGKIHLGNMATMALSGIVASRIGPHMSEIDLTVCDLDMPDTRDWNIQQYKYVKYFAELPDVHKCHKSMLGHAMHEIQEFMGGIGRELGVNYNTRLLSEVQKKEDFRKGLKRVLDNGGLIKYLYPRIEQERVLVFPLCPKCNTANPNASEYRNGMLINSCSNPECSNTGKKIELDILDSSRDIAVHYFIDPLRDRTVKPVSDIHVFGGDYRESHESGDSKIEKILKVIGEAALGEVPDILIGPTFYSRDGTKMSKSKDNGLTITKLREYFGEGYPERIVNLMRNILQADLRVVDYQVVSNSLFERDEEQRAH